jgi:hypothetical protein
MNTPVLLRVAASSVRILLIPLQIDERKGKYDLQEIVDVLIIMEILQDMCTQAAEATEKC